MTRRDLGASPMVGRELGASPMMFPGHRVLSCSEKGAAVVAGLMNPM